MSRSAGDVVLLFLCNFYTPVFDNSPHHKIGLKLGVAVMLLRKTKPTTLRVMQLNSLANRKPGWTSAGREIITGSYKVSVPVFLGLF